MSLSIEIKVNGNPVAILEAHNVGVVHEDVRNKEGKIPRCRYEGQLVELAHRGYLEQPRGTRLNDVLHHTHEGILKLSMSLLYKAVLATKRTDLDD